MKKDNARPPYPTLGVFGRGERTIHGGKCICIHFTRASSGVPALEPVLVSRGLFCHDPFPGKMVSVKRGRQSLSGILPGCSEKRSDCKIVEYSGNSENGWQGSEAPPLSLTSVYQMESFSVVKQGGFSGIGLGKFYPLSQVTVYSFKKNSWFIQ